MASLQVSRDVTVHVGCAATVLLQRGMQRTCMLDMTFGSVLDKLPVTAWVLRPTVLRIVPVVDLSVVPSGVAGEHSSACTRPDRSRTTIISPSAHTYIVRYGAVKGLPFT